MRSHWCNESFPQRTEVYKARAALNAGIVLGNITSKLSLQSDVYCNGLCRRSAASAG